MDDGATRRDDDHLQRCTNVGWIAFGWQCSILTELDSGLGRVDWFGVVRQLLDKVRLAVMIEQLDHLAVDPGTRVRIESKWNRQPFVLVLQVYTERAQPIGAGTRTLARPSRGGAIPRHAAVATTHGRNCGSLWQRLICDTVRARYSVID